MDASELRALQAPLKQRYREAPESALIPARAEGVLDGAEIACRIPARGGETTAGLHLAAGGTGALACSADMLLEALVACAGVTLLAVATAIALFGFQSGAALATVVGVLVEVPVMLSVVRIVKASRPWYERRQRA